MANSAMNAADTGKLFGGVQRVTIYPIRDGKVGREEEIRLSPDKWLEIEFAYTALRERIATLEQERTARDAECTAVLRLAEGRIAMLMKADLPDSDHPVATEYVLREIRRTCAERIRALSTEPQS